MNTQKPRHYFHGDIRPEDGLIFNASADNFQSIPEFWASERFDGRVPNHKIRLQWSKAAGVSRGLYRPKNAPSVL